MIGNGFNGCTWLVFFHSALLGCSGLVWLALFVCSPMCCLSGSSLFGGRTVRGREVSGVRLV